MSQDVAAGVQMHPLAGELKQSTQVYLQPLQGYDSASSITELEVSTGFESGFLNVKINPWVRALGPYAVGGDRRSYQIFFEAKEAWLELYSDDVDLRLGNQILTWGSSDSFSPNDVWNPVDLIDPLQPIKLPVPLAKLSFHPRFAEDFILDLVAVPQFRPHLLPIRIFDGASQSFVVFKEDSRWLIPTPSLARLGSDNAVPITYRVDGADRPQDWQWGGRLRMLRAGGWDFALNYSQTTLPMPVFETKFQGVINDPELPIDISLRPLFYRATSWGIDGNGTWGPWGLRFDLALRQSVASDLTSDLNGNLNPVIPAKTYLGVVGIDRVFYIKKNEFYVNAMLVYKEDTDVILSDVTIGVPNFEPWDRNLILVLENRFSAKVKGGFRSVTSFQQEDGWISPYGSYLFADSLLFEVGVDLFWGSVVGAYGQFKDNQRFRSLLSYNF